MSRAVMQKEVVGLRIASPFPPPDLFSVWEWSEFMRDKLADDLSPSTIDDFIEQELEMASMTEEMEIGGEMVTIPLVHTWGVWIGDELGGYVKFIRDAFHPWTGNAHCIFKKSFWGHRITAPALTRIAKEIFDLGIERIEMTPFEKNSGIRALIKKIGGQQEGLLRMKTMQKGKFVNIVVYGLLRSELIEEEG